MNPNNNPDFRSKKHLLDHISSILDFYLPRCQDNENGGFFHCYRDDGSIYDKATRHLVTSQSPDPRSNSCSVLFPSKKEQLAPLIRQGLAFLREVHRNPKTGGYAWTLNLETKEKDSRNLTYGLAFVLLAYSHAAIAGILPGKQEIEETEALLDKYMWEVNPGLYADEMDENWEMMKPYRGQNCNMHACEAHMAAYKATGEKRHLDRAQLIAFNLANKLSQICGKVTGLNLIYEHYVADWSQPDFEHNKQNPKDIFQPWGYQPGHLVEWSRLLLELNKLKPEEWYIPRAIELFQAGVGFGWDKENEGLVYSFEPNKEAFQCDKDKYKWVQIEAIATAAMLIVDDKKNEAVYWEWYDKLWAYSWKFFVDHKYGAWFRILDPQNKKIDDLKSPPGKVDYHSIGGCIVCFNVL